MITSDEDTALALIEKIKSGMTIDTNLITCELINPTLVHLGNLHKHTDEETIRTTLEAFEEFKNKLKNIQVDRIPDIDRGNSKAMLKRYVDSVHNANIDIKWVRRLENGFVEAKLDI